MYLVNVNNGTVSVVTSDCRANGMGVFRDGMCIYIYLFIYLFIWSLVKDALMNFIFIVSNNWMQ